MNPNTNPTLVSALLRKAERLRSLTVLAGAFRVQKPEWGSQAVLTALGLGDYLAYIRWDLSIAQESFPYWLEEVGDMIDPKILPIRTSQIRELNTMINEPRPVTLQVNPNSTLHPELAAIMTASAGFGLLYSDLPFLQGVKYEYGDHGQATIHLLGSEFVVPEEHARMFEKWRLRFPQVTALEYLHAVDQESRKWHPNTVRAATMDYLEKVGRVSNPFALQTDGTAGVHFLLASKRNQHNDKVSIRSRSKGMNA